jgi:hypothetical protein
MLLSFGFVLSAEEEVRTWTDLKGRTMEARFIKFTGDKMVIKRADGRSFTVMPDLFSEVDRKYVEEMRGKVGADGKPWGKSSVIQALVSGKWRDVPEDAPIVYYWDFKRERVDLDGDGKPDGYKAWRRANGGVFRKGRAWAWEATDEGKLIIRHKSALSSRPLESELTYDVKTRSFLLTRGAVPKYLKSAKRQIEK